MGTERFWCWVNLIYTTETTEIVGGVVEITINNRFMMRIMIRLDLKWNPEYETNFTHCRCLAGKIKFYKDDTQTIAQKFH